MAKILYLGLSPGEWACHYPVIRTEKCPYLPDIGSVWGQVTHIVFTSQQAVLYWPGPWDKGLVAIGPATAAALRNLGLEPLVASEATQEGVLALLETIAGGYFLLPRSIRARPFLTDELQKKRIPFFVIDLYDTVFQKLEPVPNLDDFDEVVFTSPSTVEGFLKIYGQLPKNKKLTAIGPITAQSISANLE